LLVEFGDTRWICNVSVGGRRPRFLRGSGQVDLPPKMALLGLAPLVPHCSATASRWQAGAPFTLGDFSV